MVAPFLDGSGYATNRGGRFLTYTTPGPGQARQKGDEIRESRFHGAPHQRFVFASGKREEIMGISNSSPPLVGGARGGEEKVGLSGE